MGGIPPHPSRTNPATRAVKSETEHKNFIFHFLKKVVARKIKKLKIIFCELVPFYGTAAEQNELIFFRNF
jgi:hypothetical protein